MASIIKSSAFFESFSHWIIFDVYIRTIECIVTIWSLPTVRAGPNNRSTFLKAPSADKLSKKNHGRQEKQFRPAEIIFPRENTEYLGWYERPRIIGDPRPFSSTSILVEVPMSFSARSFLYEHPRIVKSSRPLVRRASLNTEHLGPIKYTSVLVLQGVL